MKYRTCFLEIAACMACVTMPSLIIAQSAETRVDVGPGHAAATGQANGQWKLVDTNSHVGGAGSLGRALAVGVGPGGVSLSHSIGINAGTGGAGHNFNLSVGSGGSHVSHGGVLAAGGGSRVIAGGQTQHTWNGPPHGGSAVTGFGRHVRAYSQSQSHPFQYPRRIPSRAFGARPFPF